jgi:hypothetical protein
VRLFAIKEKAEATKIVKKCSSEINQTINILPA